MRPVKALLTSFLVAFSAPAIGQDRLELTFNGSVEPQQRAQIANQIDGVVEDVHFQTGQPVARGDLLFSIDDEGFKLDVAAAKAAHAEATARLTLAKDVADRQARLVRRGTGAEANAAQSALRVRIAEAAAARAGAALASAELALSRTQIGAPISGTAQHPVVARGAFVEAEGGTVLGEIVQTDPALVAYRVPYSDRQKALAKAGVRSVKELFKLIDLTARLPSGELYPHAGKPVFESAELDEKTGMLTTWGRFPNPNGVLIPGLEVTITSVVSKTPPQETKE